MGVLLLPVEFCARGSYTTIFRKCTHNNAQPVPITELAWRWLRRPGVRSPCHQQPFAFVFHTGPQNCSDDCAAAVPMGKNSLDPDVRAVPAACGSCSRRRRERWRVSRYARGHQQCHIAPANNRGRGRQVCRALPGCNTLNIDIESAIANASAQSHQLTTFVAELADAAKQGSAVLADL